MDVADNKRDHRGIILAPRAAGGDPQKVEALPERQKTGSADA